MRNIAPRNLSDATKQRATIVAAARAHAARLREMIKNSETCWTSDVPHHKQQWTFKGAAGALETFADEIEAWKP